MLPVSSQSITIALSGENLERIEFARLIYCSWISPVLILIYNTILTIGALFLLPILMPLVLASAKRRRTFRQRMGWCRYRWQMDAKARHSERIWVHALSVGEVMSAQPLIEQVRKRCPDAELFVTVSTLTGFQTARRIIADPSIHLGYFPYDWIWAVRRVGGMIRPTRVIITETDIWPTFMWEMRRKKVPVDLVNLRISDRTWKNYKRFRFIVKSMYSAFDRLCVQTSKELERLTRLVIPTDRISVTGNLKFDSMDLNRTLQERTQLSDKLSVPEGHRILVAGSTHEGEEKVLCGALGSILNNDATVSMVLVPRDPGRSHEIQRLCRQHDLDSVLLSRMETLSRDHFPQVLIVDTIGLLRDLYGLAYLSFVGGSMAPFGGHNPLEPAFWGKPVLFGSDMSDFGLIAEYLVKSGGAVQVTDAEHLHLTVTRLMRNPELVKKMGRCTLDVVKAHQGAVDRTLAHLGLGE